MTESGFVAGIDGGGTRTTLVCLSDEGKTKEVRTFGAFNLNGIGEAAFRNLLSRIKVFLEGKGKCRALCIGASGVDNSLLSSIIHEVFSEEDMKLILVSDYETAHAGAFAGDEGIIVISGTGSVCYGRTRDGRHARSGGWGHLIGDMGSGYGIGKDALSAVACDIDGCGENTVITSIISKELGLHDQNTIISYVYSRDKSAVAALSPVVEKAFGLGDSVARKILERNAEALADNVAAVAGKLGLEKGKIALLGGMLEHDTFFRKQFVGILGRRLPDIEIVLKEHDAAEGAALMALASAGN